MPLDQQIEALLEQLGAMESVDYREVTPEGLRQMMKTLAAADGPPEAVASVEEARADGPAGPIPLRVYRPAGADPGGGPDENAGALVHISEATPKLPHEIFLVFCADVLESIGRAQTDVVGNVVDGGFENQGVSGKGVPLVGFLEGLTGEVTDGGGVRVAQGPQQVTVNGAVVAL